jgi:general secretion pathway protein G
MSLHHQLRDLTRHGTRNPRPARPGWRDSRGWTLLEMVIVMALIIILASIAVSQHRNAVARTKEAVLKENLFRMRDAIDQYYADKNRYPSDLQSLVSDQYIREVPQDPITASNSTWQTVPAEADPSNPSADVGIYNVKSGSARQALDGTNYADW